MRQPLVRFVPVTLALILATTSLAAQQGQAPPTCAGPEYRQFDFWVGEWDVTVSGKPAGTNRITSEEDGCLIHEHWAGQGGGTGQSLNFYDRADRQWHQVWVDSGGNALHLSGTREGNQLRLTGMAPGPDGKPARQRLTFTANADGSVRQLWESSADGGTWTVVFDGLYRRRGA